MASHGQAPFKTGDIDPSFGEDGVSLLAVDGATVEFQGIAHVRETSAIALAVTATYGNDNARFAVAHISRDGQVDKAFGKDGTALSADAHLSVDRHAIQPLAWVRDSTLVTVDHKVPYDPIPGVYRLRAGVAAFTSAGEPSGFAYAGLFDPEILGGLQVESLIIAEASDTRVFLAGFAYEELEYRLLLIQLTPEGKLDVGFDGVGYMTLEFPVSPWDYFSLSDTLAGAAFQSDGKLVVCSSGPTVLSNRRTPPTLRRYLSTGELDTSFGDAGTVTISYEEGEINGFTTITQFRLLADDSIRLAGYWTNLDSPDNNEGATAVLVALEADGYPDLTWSGTGYTRFTASYGFTSIGSFDIDAEGRVIAAGRQLVIASTEKLFNLSASPTGDGSPRKSGPLARAPRVDRDNDIMFRYLPNGHLDTSFGGGAGFVLLGSHMNHDGAHILYPYPSLIDLERNRVLFAAEGLQPDEVAITAYVLDGGRQVPASH